MQYKRIAVLISGSGSNLQSLIDKQKNYFNGEIVYVFSNIRQAYGLERARQNNIETGYLAKKDFLSPEDYDKKLVDLLKTRQIDLIVLAGYLRIITPVLIDEYRDRIINIHPSLLPSFGGLGCYGLYVHEKVLERGCKVSGATVHFVDEHADAGPIIIQRALQIDQNWSKEDLQKEVLKIEHQILPEAVKLFCDNRLEIKDKRVFIKE
ncbi:MAG: phosphoribosylglycinamide formyltransferase [Tissierellia bacterium]|nr:phosphoribosylglycinamide formyltransferase [Tissierellia bacterium]